jgi:hypothetical protein
MSGALEGSGLGEGESMDRSGFGNFGRSLNDANFACAAAAALVVGQLNPSAQVDAFDAEGGWQKAFEYLRQVLRPAAQGSPATLDLCWGFWGEDWHYAPSEPSPAVQLARAWQELLEHNSRRPLALHLYDSPNRPVRGTGGIRAMLEILSHRAVGASCVAAIRASSSPPKDSRRCATAI